MLLPLFIRSGRRGCLWDRVAPLEFIQVDFVQLPDAETGVANANSTLIWNAQETPA
jgi:hypothetical protein